AIGVVTVHVQHGGNLAVELFRLVEEAGDPEPRQGLKSQLLDLVAWSTVDRVEPDNRTFRGPPRSGLATEDHPVEGLSAQPLGDLLTLGGRLHHGHPRNV